MKIQSWGKRKLPEHIIEQQINKNYIYIFKLYLNLYEFCFTSVWTFVMHIIYHITVPGTKPLIWPIFSNYKEVGWYIVWDEYYNMDNDSMSCLKERAWPFYALNSKVDLSCNKATCLENTLLYPFSTIILFYWFRPKKKLFYWFRHIYSCFIKIKIRRSIFFSYTTIIIWENIKLQVVVKKIKLQVEEKKMQF